MSTPNFGFLSGLTTMEDVQGALARLKRELDFYFQGKISTSNIRELSGWQASETELMSLDGDVGMSTADTVSNDVRFWAGDTDKDNAPFMVYEDGHLFASDVDLTGKITATSGAIGGWAIDADSISDVAGLVGLSSAVSGGNDVRMWAGAVDPATAPYRVYEDGSMVATDADITGSITATSGSIGGWTIGSSMLSGAGLIQGGTIQTSGSGDRVVMDSDGFRSEDSNGYARINISPSTPTYGVGGIEFHDETDTYKGILFSDSVNDLSLVAFQDLNLTSQTGQVKINGNHVEATYANFLTYNSGTKDLKLFSFDGTTLSTVNLT